MKKYLIGCLFLGLITYSGCKKYVEIPPPQDQLLSSLVFTDDKTATSAMVGLYSSLNAFNSSFANFHVNFMPAMSADDFYYSLSVASYNEFADNTLTPSNSNVAKFWDPVYSYIYHANAILEGVDKATGLSETVKKQLKGEASFLRAYFYFYLVNIFGDVPLILDTDYRVNTSKPRTGVDSVYAAIINDLLTAQSNLPDNYPSSERVRANKAVATALLARVYLYRADYVKAEEEATKVIGNSNYALLTDLNTVFLKNSRETILQWQSINKSTAGVNTWEGFNIVPAVAGGRAYYNLTNSLVNAFETGDKRKANWTNTYVLSGTTYYYPYKYKIRTKSTVDEYSMVIRLAEMYLIRAEARVQQPGKIDLGVQDLNVIRGRAGVPALSESLSKADALLAIENERWKELFTEAGHRWLDLKRNGRAVAVLKTNKGNTIDANDLLYPIPTTALLSNRNLVQNPGYN